jgi:phospholipid transport system substrate-binding protein
MMTTRRHMLLATLVGAGGLALPWTAARAADEAQASAFVKKLLTELIGVVDGSGSDASKRAALEKLVEESVDVAGVARFCLGRYWRQASAAQQQEYLGLFRRVLMNNITGRIGDYSGVTFAMGRTQPRDGGVSVSTTVTRPNNAPNGVDWIVEDEGGKPIIVDVIAEGTSLRLTQRSDYASFLNRNNGDVGTLIAAMKRQAS